jgi:hypothetical protein
MTKTEYLTVFDPRGRVETERVTPAPRVASLDGLLLGILDNTKWNANKLLRGVRDRLAARHGFGAVNYYSKERFSLAAAPELIARIAAECDVVVTAIGD